MIKRSQLAAILSQRLNWVGISVSTVSLFNAFSPSAIASDVIGNQGIRFAEDTIVEFEFIESHGAYKSTFGVINLDTCQTDSSGTLDFDSCIKTPLLSEVKASDDYSSVHRRSSYETNIEEARYDDFLGTPGNAVPEPQTEFLFQADKKYAFYLESQFDGQPAGTVYSTDLINSRLNRQALFNESGLTLEAVAKRRNTSDENVNQFNELIDGGLVISFDDTGSALVKTESEDTDFDDFIVGVGGGILCEYPDEEIGAAK